MEQSTAIKRLNHWDRRGRFVFTLTDLAKVFHEDNPRTLKGGLSRLVASGLLERAARGVYVYPMAHSRDSYVIEHIAKALRRGEYNYVSLESALSEYGAISQIPLDRLTVMTTGRKGIYKTAYGTIEFVHTKRPVKELLARMSNVERPLHLATPLAAWGDLKRVGRNAHLVDETVLKHG
jgi:predicted transcriptional regulator of viral defense system